MRVSVRADVHVRGVPIGPIRKIGDLMIYRFVGGPCHGRHVAIPLAVAERLLVFRVPIQPSRSDVWKPIWMPVDVCEQPQIAEYRFGPPIVGRSVATYVGPPALQSPTSCPKT